MKRWRNFEDFEVFLGLVSGFRGISEGFPILLGVVQGLGGPFRAFLRGDDQSSLWPLPKYLVWLDFGGFSPWSVDGSIGIFPLTTRVF